MSQKEPSPLTYVLSCHEVTERLRHGDMCIAHVVMSQKEPSPLTHYCVLFTIKERGFLQIVE